jgi:hypothetical protein
MILTEHALDRLTTLRVAVFLSPCHPNLIQNGHLGNGIVWIGNNDGAGGEKAKFGPIRLDAESHRRFIGERVVDDPVESIQDVLYGTRDDGRRSICHEGPELGQSEVHDVGIFSRAVRPIDIFVVIRWVVEDVEAFGEITPLDGEELLLFAEKRLVLFLLFDRGVEFPSRSDTTVCDSDIGGEFLIDRLILVRDITRLKDCDHLEVATTKSRTHGPARIAFRRKR